MKRAIISITILLASVLSLSSQEANSLYFLNEWSQRHTLNAAFAPEYGYYSLPIIGGFNMNLSSNTGLSTFIYHPYNSDFVTFLHSSVPAQEFLGKLDQTTFFKQGMNLNLLSFGFYTKRNSFWSFDVSLKENMDVNIPIGFFQLVKLGMQSSSNTYDLKNLSINQSNIAQVSLGYSRDINSQWRVGINAKLLAGLSYANINYSKFDVKLANDQYTATAVGQMDLRSEFVSFDKDANGNYDFSTGKFLSSGLKPAGLGAAFDLGATYKPIKKLTLAAGIKDIGFINWKASAIKKGTANGNFLFNGFANVNADSLKFTDQVNQLRDDAKTLIQFKEQTTSSNITEKIPYTLNASAEYSIFGNDKHDISVGLLWNSYNAPGNHINDLVGALNLKPLSWFTLSTTYEFLRKDYSRVGMALNLSPRWINIFIASDCIMPKLSPQYLPIDKFNLNLSVGVSFVIGRPIDTDKDGVCDRWDKCPNTPKGIKVDKKGCPIDTDGDGVPDYKDKCPDTPKEAFGKVDSVGCPLDTDGDGVPDYLDLCPGTPVSARGFVDVHGCTIDKDSDGVADYLDKCPNTPVGVKVDSVGCPLDSDGDGVPDYLDLCPGTPAQAKGFVDKNGCPLDTDGDGVPDYLDKCPNTPIGVKVDLVGCPLDSDGDGVPDYLDKCPNTPKEAYGKVDSVGCPLDTDDDGVPDYLDKCPTVPGVASNSGCPEVKKEIKALLHKALQGVQFESGKSVIKKTSYVILNRIAQAIKENPAFLIEVRGHTDNVGDVAKNLVMSQNRADAVRDYLIQKGVSEKKITAKGFGDKLPIATNTTAVGRKLNRRVEFSLTFEK